MNVYVTALVLSLITVGVIVYLMRSRRIREKYAAAWMTLAAAVVILGAFPGLLARLANVLGVVTPVNLLFFVAGLVLLVVCVQFSIEISTLEEETRTLAEEIALLTLRVESLQAPGTRHDGTDPDVGSGTVARDQP